MKTHLRANNMRHLAATLGLQYAEPGADVAELMRLSQEQKPVMTQPAGYVIVSLTDGKPLTEAIRPKPRPKASNAWEEMYNEQSELAELAIEIATSLNEEVTRLRARIAQLEG